MGCGPGRPGRTGRGGRGVRGDATTDHNHQTYTGSSERQRRLQLRAPCCGRGHDGEADHLEVGWSRCRVKVLGKRLRLAIGARTAATARPNAKTLISIKSLSKTLKPIFDGKIPFN